MKNKYRKILLIIPAIAIFIFNTNKADASLLATYSNVVQTQMQGSTGYFKDSSTAWSGTVAKIYINAPANSVMAKYMTGFYGTPNYGIKANGDYTRIELKYVRTETDGSITGVLDGTGDTDGANQWLNTVSNVFPNNGDRGLGFASVNNWGSGIYHNAWDGSANMYVYSDINDVWTLPVPTCDPATIENGTIGEYPTCAISCNSGYELIGGACVAVQSGGSGAMTISTSTTAGVYAMVSGMIGDPGFLGVVALSVGIPLTVFYIIPSILGLFPGRKKRK